MPNYYVNILPQSSGEHEVHESTCNQGALPSHQKSLGWHPSCTGAVQSAKQFYSKVDGCKYCSKTCHTK